MAWRRRPKIKGGGGGGGKKGGGRVEIRDTKTTRLVTSFRPRGLVRAIALSVTRAAVLVETKSELRIEWYDADSGARLGAFAVPSSTAHRISTDGRFAAFAAGKTLRVLDLATGRQLKVARPAEHGRSGFLTGTGRLVWGENGGLARPDQNGCRRGLSPQGARAPGTRVQPRV